MKITLRHLIEDEDRHGNVRVYFRMKGKPKVRLREKFGTPEFMIEYECAKSGRPYKGKAIESPVTSPAAARSFKWLCQQYFRRAAKSVSVGTMSRRRAILEGICEKYGNLPFDGMERRHVTSLRDTRLDHPGAANNIVKAISAMYKWAIDAGECKTNPCAGIKRLKSGDGWHTWTPEEIEQYQERHTKGSTARLALTIFMCTGLRLSDAAILGRQHITEGWIKIRPGKTSHSSAVDVELPILAMLRNEITASSSNRMTLLVTEYGKPFSENGLGNKMRQWCDEAGLPHCSAHGLRKAGATIAAENGATSEQLKAIFGWTTSQQADLYTRKARRKTMAEDAAHLMIPGLKQNKSVPLSKGEKDEWDNNGK